MQLDDLKLDNCVKCSDCNAACPVSRVYPDYPGPKALGPDMERFRREGVPSDTKWVEYCLGCHGCDVVCPHGVNVSELIAKGKTQHQKSGLASAARPLAGPAQSGGNVVLQHGAGVQRDAELSAESLAHVVAERDHRQPAFSCVFDESSALGEGHDVCRPGGAVLSRLLYPL